MIINSGRLLFAPLTPFFDVGGPVLLLQGVALLGVVVVSILIIVIEALILWRWFNYGSLSSSSVASLVMNITTTIIGILLLILALNITLRLPTAFLFLLSWVLTVVVEAGVLKLMKRQATWLRVGQMSLTVNIISYLLLIAIGLFFGQ